ncbi:MAG: DNA polymerase I [Actinomycetaceae bacterium]|nr:DNA polymerase I [Actinomycetaceae bacterium]
MTNQEFSSQHSAACLHDATLLVIDGHSVAFRAFYALPAESFHAENGQCTNAVYGFMTMLMKMLDDHQPTHIAVAFDVSRHSFRTDVYPEYKAQREDTPEEFRGQVELIKQLLHAMNITTCEIENYEADDIVATLSSLATQAQMDTLVASGDRDTFQLINDHVTVIYPGRSTSDLRLMTPQAVEEKYGVQPHRYPEIAAIVGEKADNLPGVPGVGPKTAAQWLTKYDGLENLIVSRDELGGKRGNDFRAHIDDVQRNRQLNRLRTDLDLGFTLADLERKPFDRHTMNRLFDELSFGGLRKRIFTHDPAAHSIGKDTSSTTKNHHKEGVKREGTQQKKSSTMGPSQHKDDASGGLTSHCETITAKDLQNISVNVLAPGELFNWLKQYSKDSVTFLVTGDSRPGRGDAQKVVLCVKNQAAIIKLYTATPNDLQALEDLFDGSHRLTTHDQKGAWHALKGAGINLKALAFDTELAAYICRPSARSYDIALLSRNYLDINIEDDDRTDAAKGQATFDFDTDDSINHGLALKAHTVCHLHNALAHHVRDSHHEQLLHDVELPVQRILTDMENSGIAIDNNAITDLRKDYEHEALRYEDLAHETAGKSVNLNSPKQLQEVLFDKLNMPKTKRTKSGYTTNAAALNDLYVKTQHPFLEHLLAYRDKTKLLQIVDGLMAATLDDGRIHSSFQQTVTATGRLSSVDPNLQNIPARSEEGLRIRDCFVSGTLEPHQQYEALLTADYSQIEMRIMAHMSQDDGLLEAFTAGEDLHKTMAAMVFNVGIDEVTRSMRSRIKATSYGLAYGLSSYGLSQQLGIDVGEAKTLMNNYFQRFGGVQRYLRHSVEKARECGYTETILGRRRYLPELTSSNNNVRQSAERAALNAPIQGSAADIIKLAMIDVDKQLQNKHLKSRMLLQVHDELVLEIAPGETAAVTNIVRSCMSHTIKLDVPLDVSVGVGQSWLKAAHA